LELPLPEGSLLINEARFLHLWYLTFKTPDKKLRRFEVNTDQHMYIEVTDQPQLQ